jgi:alpha-tubulin suppressor-like RCC1 family protein
MYDEVQKRNRRITLTLSQMNLFAINTDNVVFLAGQKMYSTGLVRMYEDGCDHVRSVPKLVIGKVIHETRFKHISANTATDVECNCAISVVGEFVSWGNNTCGQQGNMVMSDFEEEGTEDGQEAGESQSQDAFAENEEGPSENEDSSGGEEESSEKQQPDDEENRRYDGRTIWHPDKLHGAVYSCNPVCRGREHFGGEIPATAVCSEKAYFVLTDAGNVWCVGDDARMKSLVMSDRYSHFFAKIPSQFFNGTTVASIAIGLEHMLAVCTEGFVWAWGSNRYCAAGAHEEIQNQQYPEKVCTTMWNDKTFSAVSAGENHSVALDTDGILWEWGQRHALTCSKRVSGGSFHTSIFMHTEPSKVSSTQINFTSPIQNISCGPTFTLALDNAGRVWSFGVGDNGELGLGRHRLTELPMQITGFANQSALISISSGQSMCGAVSCQGDVYIWGRNFYCDTKGMKNMNLISKRQRYRIDGMSTPVLVMVTHTHSESASTAFLMALHRRLGVNSHSTKRMPEEIAYMILQPTYESVSLHDRTSGL